MTGTRQYIALLFALFFLCLNACNSDPTGRCLFNHMIGEMTIDPVSIQTSGLPEAEITIQVQLIGEGCIEPLEGATVEIFSSRNKRDETVDVIQQPAGPTDLDGRAVAYLGTTCPGESQITVSADGAFLCESLDGGQCSPLVQTVSFYLSCDSGSEICGCSCKDLNTDPQNCGSCGYICTFQNASAECIDGICELSICDDNWGDCNSLESDGCETDLLSDASNCGSCGITCDDGNDCTDDSCDGEGACLNQFNTNPCDDGNPDTLWDTCHFGVCLGGGGLPDTGQRVCYDELTEIECQGTAGDPSCGGSVAHIDLCGQDAQYGWDTEHDSSERYSVVDPTGNGEEVVVDHITGIHWQRIVETDKTWQEAVDHCFNLIYSGFDDWFLPDIHQLHSIVDYGNYGPAIDTDAFPGVYSLWLWSSTYIVGTYRTYAWQVWQRDGQVDAWETVEVSGVRCARAAWNAHPDQSDRFVRYDPIENMPVVVDRLTGLMWQGCQNGFTGSDCEVGDQPRVMRWSWALRLCESLDWGGYNDWYLPNVKEIMSILDTERGSPYLNTDAFPQPTQNQASYWTSTTWTVTDLSPLRAYRAGFDMGHVGAGRKDVGSPAMCVRRGR